MSKNFIIFIGITSIFLFSSCNRRSALTDPYNYAPYSPNSSWSPLNKSTTITSKFCSTLFPKEYKEDDNLTLAELIDVALMNNPLTKQSWSNARAVSAQYGQVLSTYLPEITLDASYTRERQEVFNLGTGVDETNNLQPYFLTTVDPEATLSYMIYDFGKRKYSSESAKQALYYADWMHNWQIQDVMQNVMTSYYDYQFQKEELVALKADLENASASLDAASKKFITGTAAVGDVVQAKTQYLQTKMNLISQENYLDTSYANLLNNLGVPANKKIGIEDLPEKAEINFVLDNLDNLILQAQNMRQDFLAAQANVKYSAAQVNYSKSQLLPDIGSFFDLGRNYYNKGLHEEYHFKAEVTLSIPLFKGLYYQNGIKNAEAKFLQSKALLEQTELDMIKEVTVSHSTVNSAANTLLCAKDYLIEANKRFEIALTNYKAGTGTILDVISAQSSLADARAKNARAKKDWFSSIATLAYSTGALCTPDKKNKMDRCYEN